MIVASAAHWTNLQPGNVKIEIVSMPAVCIPGGMIGA